MKTLLTAILSLALVATSLSSYSQYNYNRSDKHHYAKICLGDGLFIPLASSVKTLSATFPYSKPDANGAPVPATFYGQTHSPFTSIADYLSFNIDIGFNDHFFTIKYDGMPTQRPGMSMVSLGYGYNWNLQQGSFGSALDPNAGLFNVSASMSVALVNRVQLLGSIANDGSTITAFGEDISPDYTIYHKGGSTSHHANEIAVAYSHTNYGLMPQIAISTNPYKTMLNFEFYISYFLPVFKTSGINLYQHADGAGLDSYHYATNSNIDKNGIVVTGDNAVYSRSPFNLSCLQIGVKIGIQGKL